MAGELTIDTLHSTVEPFATGNAFSGMAKAWVNFDGTNGSIRGSFNVSSVTIVATANMQVNFTASMPNANYAIFVAGQGLGSTGGFAAITPNVTPSTTMYAVCSVNTSSSSLAYTNFPYMTTGVFA